MNIRCCIIENESIYIDTLTRQLHTWAKKNMCSLSVTTSASGSLFTQQTVRDYDIIFLDIVLDQSENGIDIAHALRTANYEGDIVFLTNFKEYVFDGYPVRALDYLMKPAAADKLEQCMDKVLERLSDKNFIYRIKGTIHRIPYMDILYFSSCNHQTQIVTKTESCFIPQTLRSVSKQLPKSFVQCHRTSVINLRHVIRIAGKELLLSNQECVPISDTFLEQVRHAFLEQLN